MNKEKVLNAIPVRKFKGEIVPYSNFLEFIRILNTYKFNEQELSLILAEIEQLKKDMQEGQKKSL